MMKKGCKDPTVGDWLSKSQKRHLGFPPEDTMDVVLYGDVEVYGRFDIERLVRATPLYVLEKYRVDERRAPAPRGRTHEGA